MAAEALAHTREKLNGDYSIILVGIIVSHFDDVLQDKISPISIVEFVGDLPKLLACFFLYVQMVKIEKLDENGDYCGFYVLLVGLILFQVYHYLWDLVKEGFGDVLSIFDLF